MVPEIFLWSGERELFLARQDFFVEQVKTRVLGNFDNMEEEANRVADEVYEQIGAMPSYGDYDMSDAAETAMEHGQEFYMMLSEMRTQTILGALASLYHQWDKGLRSFLERELSRYYVRDEIVEYCWHPNIGKQFDVIEEFGWPVRSASWFPLVNACRLIVNVYKHGKGRSLDDLAKHHPEYLKGPFDHMPEASWLTTPDHEDLSVTLEEFDQIAAALRQFWVEFPERLVLAEPTPEATD